MATECDEPGCNGVHTWPDPDPFEGTEFEGLVHHTIVNDELYDFLVAESTNPTQPTRKHMSQLTSKHQTAVFINADVRADRAKRLIESLNGDNIKADVYRVSETTVTTLVITTLAGDTVAGAELAEAGDDLDFETLAREAGYNTLIVVSNVSAS